MNTQRLHQALRRTLVPTWCVAACLAWGDSPTVTPADKKFLSALVSMSEEEKLRAIDSLVNRQSTSLEVRSALRRASIQDSSAEVRGAARFALVKLQALAPPTLAATPGVVAAIVPDETQRLRDLKLKEMIEEVNDTTADREIAQAGAVAPKSNNPAIQHAISQPSDGVNDHASSPAVVRITTINSPPSGPVQVAGSSNTQSDTTQVPSPRKEIEQGGTPKPTGAAIASVESNPVWHSAMKPTESAVRVGAEKSTLPSIAASEGPTNTATAVPVPETVPSEPAGRPTVPNPVRAPSLTLAPAEPPKVPINTSPTETPSAEVASDSSGAESSKRDNLSGASMPSVPIAPPAAAPSITGVTTAPASSELSKPTAPAPVAVPAPTVAPPVVAESVEKVDAAAPSLPPAVIDQLPAVGISSPRSPISPPAVAASEVSSKTSPAPPASVTPAPTQVAVAVDPKAVEAKTEKVTAFAGKKIPRTEIRSGSDTTLGNMTEFPPVRTPSALAASMGQDESKESPSPVAKLPPTPPTAVPNEKPAWGVPSPGVATNAGLGRSEMTTAQLEKAPQLAIDSIPRDEEGRKKMAKEMLDKARKFVDAGQIAEAESVLYQVRELAVKYGRFQYSPESLEKDIIKARQRLRAQAAAAAEKTT